MKRTVVVDARWGPALQAAVSALDAAGVEITSDVIYVAYVALAAAEPRLRQTWARETIHRSLRLDEPHA